LLNGRLALYDVEDAERLAARALSDQLRSTGARLSHHDNEDALAYLLVVCWEASIKFDPERSPSFGGYAYGLCRRRTVDWLRQRHGRTKWTFGPNAKHTHAGGVYERTRPELISFDDPDRSELASTLPGGEGDFEVGRLDLAWALKHGGRPDLRPDLQAGEYGDGSPPAGNSRAAA